MEKIQNDINLIIEKIKELKNNAKEEILMEKLLVELEYIYKKYDKKINPKYYKKLKIDKISILFYESGINLLISEDLNEKILGDLLKLVLKNPSFECIKLRKDKDFTSTSICTAKNLNKIKTGFSSNLVEYEILSLFLVIKDKKETEKEIEQMVNTKSKE